MASGSTFGAPLAWYVGGGLPECAAAASLARAPPDSGRPELPNVGAIVTLSRCLMAFTRLKNFGSDGIAKCYVCGTSRVAESRQKTGQDAFARILVLGERKGSPSSLVVTGVGVARAHW